MYRILRDTHLLLGLFLCSFTLLFGVSSLVFAHRSWFDTKPVQTEETVSVDPARAATPRALANQLIEAEGYGGWLSRIRETDDEVSFVIGRMGTIRNILYRRGAGEAQVKTRVFPFTAMLTWMHATFKVTHEYALHNVWGALMFLTSVGLLVLGGTGIYLWYRMRDERRVGTVLLAGNAAFLVLMALIWIA